MNDKLHIADADLALYAMGSLSAEEAETIAAHLESCSVCRQELRENTLALAAYAHTTPEIAPPAGARDRFLSRLKDTPQTAAASAAAQRRIEPLAAVPVLPNVPARSVELRPAQSRPTLWQSIFGPGLWSPAIAGALAVALLAVGFDDLRKRAEIAPLVREARRGAVDAAQLAQLMDLLTSPQAKKVALHTSPQATPPPEGRVVYAARTGKLLLTASNLLPLPAGKVYELWILQPGGKSPLPSGTFAPDGSGNATMILPNAPEGLDVAGFGVTIEKAGGSPTPTLPIVLSGL